ncbi:MAG: ATP--guanido phosphotransferase, partial [Christensenellales bacterium]
RVRLARNFEDIPFTNKQDAQQAEETVRRVSAAILEGPEGSAYTLSLMRDLSDHERQELNEHRLISSELIGRRAHGAALISSGRNVSVMVNEDDHLRIQSLMPGLQIERGAELAFAVDHEVGKRYPLAFDAQLGYLTSFPTDVGTGLRISVVMHLPALTLARKIGPVMQAVGKLGLTVRGFYGEGSEARGNMYVLTNQSSLGRSEDDMLRSVGAAAEQIVGHERQMREQAEKSDMLVLQDRLLRSVGEVMHSRIMSVKEMTRRLSDIRYAASMGYYHAPIRALDELLMDMQPGSLAMLAGKALTDRERDAMRSELMRKRLAELRTIE